MDFVTLGRTGLRASVLGLGGGGHSRLGQQTGSTFGQSIALVQHALALGITFIDTAESYGTENIIGQALRGGRRDAVILSTKKSMDGQNGLITPQELRQGLEASLQRLETDRVDIYHLHGVLQEQYGYAREHLVPELLKLQEQGKIGFLGLTERFAVDTGHQMLSQAVRDEPWDVVMVGFNILNQSARERVFVQTQERNLGVLNMFAVRRDLSQPAKLQQTITALREQGHLSLYAELEDSEPLEFLLHEGGALSLPDAAYRFCRAEPGVHVVLSGTGSLRHLEENVTSILRPALPAPDRERLGHLFSGIDIVSGQ
ncbi:aldo/keto reductase [bacterium]|nr:MAG: aldo/keto reductase [bacterium]